MDRCLVTLRVQGISDGAVAARLRWNAQHRRQNSGPAPRASLMCAGQAHLQNVNRAYVGVISCSMPIDSGRASAASLGGPQQQQQQHQLCTAAPSYHHLRRTRSNIVLVTEGKLKKRKFQRGKSSATGKRQPGGPSSGSRKAPGGAPGELAGAERRTPLTGKLKTAWSATELWRAIQQHPSELNGLNVSFAINRLAKVATKKPGKGEVEHTCHLLEEALLRDVHTYSARSLATALHSLGKMRRKNSAVFQVSEQRALEVMAEFTPQGLSNLLWAYASVGVHVPALFEAANHQVLHLAPKFSATETSMTLWAYTQANQRVLAVYLALQQQALRFLRRFRPDELTTIAWTFSRVASDSKALFTPIFHALEEEAVRRENEFLPNALVRMLHSFAAVRHPAPALVQMVERRVEERPMHFSASEIARLAQSCIPLGYRAQKMFSVFGQEAIIRAESFQPSELASIARAAACLGNSVPELFAAVERRLVAQPSQFSTREMAMVCRASALIGEPSRQLLDTIGTEVALRPHELKPQELANIVWAHAKIGHTASEPFHAAVVSMVLERIEGQDAKAGEHGSPARLEFKPQEICNIAWAYASMGRPMTEAFWKAKMLLFSQPERFDAQDLSSLSWAAAKANHKDEELMSAIEARATELAGEFSPQGLASILWAFAVLGQAAPFLLPALEPQVIAAAEARMFSTQGLSMVLRGYVSQGSCTSAPLFRSLARETVDLANDFSPHGFRYTVWAFAAASRHSKELVGIMTELSPAVTAAAQSYSLSELMKVLRAYARAGGATKELLTQLENQVVLRAQEASKPAHLVMAAVSLSTMHPGKRPLCSSSREADTSFQQLRATMLHAIAGPLTALASECDPRLLVLAATSYSRCTCFEADLFHALEVHGAARVADFTARQMADILEAFRGMGYPGTELFAAFERRMVSKDPPLPLQSLKPKDIAAAARAFAQLGHGSSSVVMALQHMLLDVLEMDSADARLHPSDVDALRTSFAMHPCSRESMLDKLPQAFWEAAEQETDGAAATPTGEPTQR